MLRVYHFVLDHRVGGPHVYIATLRKALLGKVESIMVTTGQGPMTDMALLNLRHLWGPLYALEMIANILFLIALVLLGRIKRENVIFNVHGSANIAPIAAARIAGIPVVWHFHEITPRFCHLVTIGRWFLIRHPHTLVVVANKAKEAYGLEDAVLLPAAVDTTFWSRIEVSAQSIDECGWKESLNGDDRPFRVLAIGNLNPLKGMDILLDALAEIDGLWHLKIIGAELGTHVDYAAKLYGRMNEIVSLNKGCIVDFLWWQEKEQVRTLLAGCDVFVLPSRSEACPIALLEAMAMGCDCVAADVGDVRSMMDNYARGHVFSAESVDALRSSIKQVQVHFRTPGRPLEQTNGIWQLSELSAKTMQIYNSLNGKK